MIPADNILLLLVMAALSSLLARLLRNLVPLPLIQILLGVVAASLGVRIGLEPDLFMLVFLPPLLFADAFRMPLREFHELRGTIFFLAFGLVVLSTVFCGYAIHWLIPTLDLACCFALAAALSPTDTVAVTSLIAGRHVPERMIHILSGEALFNDASGLVCFRFATAAAMTGVFSYRQAFGGFLLVALGGMGVGALIAYGAARINRVLLRRGFDDPPLQITLMVLLPFSTYIVAERLGGSGILASVAACMVIKMMGVIEEANTATRLQATTVWTMLSYVFNALIFLLLGLQLPSLLDRGMELAHARHVTLIQLVTLVAAVYAIMSLLRLAGLWLSILRRWLVSRWMHKSFAWPGVLSSVLLTFAGVRGAVTLAAVLSLPVAGAGMDGFPDRELIVTIAAGVIVMSLIGAGLIMPACIRFIPPEGTDRHALEERMARQTLLRAALERLQQEKHAHDAGRGRGAQPDTGPDEVPDAAQGAVQDAARDAAQGAAQGATQGTAQAAVQQVGQGGQRGGDGTSEDEAIRQDVIDRLGQSYENRLNQIDEARQITPMNRHLALRRERIELALRLVLLRAQRQALHSLFSERKINDQTEWELEQELDFEEQLLRARVQRLPQDI